MENQLTCKNCTVLAGTSACIGCKKFSNHLGDLMREDIRIEGKVIGSENGMANVQDSSGNSKIIQNPSNIQPGADVTVREDNILRQQLNS